MMADSKYLFDLVFDSQSGFFRIFVYLSLLLVGRSAILVRHRVHHSNAFNKVFIMDSDVQEAYIFIQ